MPKAYDEYNAKRPAPDFRTSLMYGALFFAGVAIAAGIAYFL
ncbi:hypothetical protein [Phyllobacterium pellucidum]|nr:hypothetical protein [Phyllobacterium pellucidum]